MIDAERYARGVELLERVVAMLIDLGASTASITITTSFRITSAATITEANTITIMSTSTTRFGLLLPGTGTKRSK